MEKRSTGEKRLTREQQAAATLKEVLAGKSVPWFVLWDAYTDVRRAPAAPVIPDLSHITERSERREIEAGIRRKHSEEHEKSLGITSEELEQFKKSVAYAEMMVGVSERAYQQDSSNSNFQEKRKWELELAARREAVSPAAYA
jgi:hypothetical protein